MPKSRIRLTALDAAVDLTSAFDQLRAEHHLDATYPSDCVAEAVAAMREVQLPERDETAVPFFTIDPVGSIDLDQAMHLEADGEGFRVRYAIADVPAYVRPGGALDAETRRRGETIYLPDGRVPLHPVELSEGGASLLPGQVRSAFVWDMRLDAQGRVQSTELYRAQVRSAERLDYTGVQAHLDAGTADPRLTLLQRIGELRAALELARGGASLPMPEQEVSATEDGYQVRFRPPAPVEDWNAHISLMTGMEAARIMLEAGVGILRTMPEPDAKDVEQFRLQAKALGVVWSSEQSYGELLQSLDRTKPRHLALIYEATHLFRGAAYTPFDGATPEVTTQAAVGAPYAHVTAPLRRLVDRFGLALCEAVVNGREVPQWVREALPQLPAIMKEADARASQVDRAAISIVEAATLRALVGQTVPTFVVARREERATVQFVDHAVVAEVPLHDVRVEPGEALNVRIDGVDVPAGKLHLSPADVPITAPSPRGEANRPTSGPGAGSSQVN